MGVWGVGIPKPIAFPATALTSGIIYLKILKVVFYDDEALEVVIVS
jgi:hypothetical protein